MRRTLLPGLARSVAAGVAATLVVCCVPGMTPAANAVEKWGAPSSLFTTEVSAIVADAQRNRPGLQVGTDASGNAVAAWLERVGTVCQAKWAGRPFAGIWGPPQPLAPPEICSGTGLSLAVNASGAAVVAWVQGSTVVAAVRPAGGSFSAPMTMGSGLSDTPAVAINSAGTVAVAWLEHGFALGDPDPLKARVRPAGGGFGSVETLSATGAAFAPSLVMDAAGNVTAAWAHRLTIDIFSGLSEFSVRTALRPAGGTFPAAPDQTLDSWTSTTGSVLEIAPDLAIDRDGRVTAVWVRENSGQRQVRSAAKVAGATTFGSAQPLNLGEAGSGRYPQVAVDARTNTAVAVWLQCASSCLVRSAARPDNGIFSGQQTLSGPLPTTNVFAPVVIFTRGGSAIAAWSGAPGGTGSQRVAAAIRPAGGSFGGAVFISGAQGVPDEKGPALADDAHGNAVAVWVRAAATPAAVVRYADFLASWYRPDGLIRKTSSKSYRGAQVYNSTGAKQIVTTKVRRGRSVTFVVKLVNRSSTADTIAVKGPGGRPGFTVSYLAGSKGKKAITKAVRSGSYSVTLAPGASRVLRLVVKAKARATVGTAAFWPVRLTSQKDTARVDVVKATVTIRS